MKTPALYIPNKSITIISNGQSKTVLNDNPFFSKAVEAYKKNDEKLFLAFINKATAVKTYLKDNKKINVKNGKVFYGEEEIHGIIVDRILEFFKSKSNPKHLIKFLTNLMENTEKDVRDQLYAFIEHNKLPITDDGAFYAFKLVTEEGKPIYYDNGKYTYEVGGVYEMPKEEVVKSTDECGGPGLYLGNQKYWNGSFNEDGSYYGKGKMLIAKVFPQWVVSVPRAECSKLRAYKFEIVQEYRNVKDATKKQVIATNVIKNKLPKRDKNGRFIKAK